MLTGLARSYGLTFEPVAQKARVPLTRAEITARKNLPVRGNPLGTELAIVRVTGKRFPLRLGSPQLQLCWVLAYPYTNRILYALIDARTNHSYGGFISTITR
jgi:hypothetical protein